MKVIGVTLSQLTDIAAATSVRIANTGNWNCRRAPYEKTRRDGRPEVRFTLRTLYSRPAPYRRTGTLWPGRKVRSLPGILCWHGHRDFMIELFRRFPAAVLESAFAKYEGVSGFHDNYPETAHRNLGSEAYPCELADACYCYADGYDERGLPKITA